MKPRIEISKAKSIIGKKMIMSFVHNRTKELWQSFMPGRKEITNPANSFLYSIEVYNDPAFFQRFDPTKQFEKWAGIEVSNFDSVPEGMETLVIPAGLYAVFVYRGAASEAEKFYRHIFMDWLPRSGYELDDRPHFAIMGEQYKNNSPDSEEEIWIPLSN